MIAWLRRLIDYFTLRPPANDYSQLAVKSAADAAIINGLNSAIALLDQQRQLTADQGATIIAGLVLQAGGDVVVDHELFHLYREGRVFVNFEGVEPDEHGEFTKTRYTATIIEPDADCQNGGEAAA